MPTLEYQQRFDHMSGHVLAAQDILRYEFETPHQPYRDAFSDMLSHAVLGVIDRNAGLIHIDGVIHPDSVVIVPFLQEDVAGPFKDMPYRLSGGFFNDSRFVPPESPYGYILNMSGMCDFDERYPIPVITLSPYLALRSTLHRGSTLLHELDHAYRARHKEEWMQGYGIHSVVGRALLELSAYDLDSRVCEMYDPENYIKEWNDVNRRYHMADFETGAAFTSRATDRHRRMLRNVAFVDVMLRALGAKVDKVPSRRILRAMKHQGLVL